MEDALEDILLTHPPIEALVILRNLARAGFDTAAMQAAAADAILAASPHPLIRNPETRCEGAPRNDE